MALGKSPFLSRLWLTSGVRLVRAPSLHGKTCMNVVASSFGLFCGSLLQKEGKNEVINGHASAMLSHGSGVAVRCRMVWCKRNTQVCEATLDSESFSGRQKMHNDRSAVNKVVKNPRLKKTTIKQGIIVLLFFLFIYSVASLV